MIYYGTGSVWVSAGWFFVILGQYRAVLVGTDWYLVVLGQWNVVLVVLCGTGSV